YCFLCAFEVCAYSIGKINIATTGNIESNRFSPFFISFTLLPTGPYIPIINAISVYRHINSLAGCPVNNIIIADKILRGIVVYVKIKVAGLEYFIMIITHSNTVVKTNFKIRIALDDI